MEDNKTPVKPRQGGALNQRIPLVWRMKLNENYAVFRDKLKPVGLTDYLLLTDKQKTDLNGMMDDHQRTDYLLKQVLRCGTKDQLIRFKEGLKATEQSHLIQYLPTNGCKRFISQGGQEEVKKKRAHLKKRCVSKGEVEELPIMVHINGTKYAKIMKQQEELMVNIREYITDCDGKLHPTKKGFLLSMKDWQSFKNGVQNVDQHLKQLKIA